MKNKSILKLSFLLFFFNLSVYIIFRSFVGVALTGGDTVNLAQGTSYSVILEQISNYPAFLAELLKSKDIPADDNPGKFLFSLFSGDGQKAIAKLAEGSGDAHDHELFNFELNSRILDKEPVSQLTYEALKNSPTKSLQDFASTIHNAMPQKEPPSFGHWLKNTFDNYLVLLPGEGSRFLVVAHIYVKVVQSFLYSYPDYVFVVILFMGVIYATLMTVLFLLAYELTKSIFWSFIAVLIYQGSPAPVKASFNLYCMPYLFVPFIMVIAIYAYMRYKATGYRIWLSLCILFAFLSPWVREFGAAVPYIIFAAEILCFQGRRSALLMGLCFLLMLHSFLPTVLLSLLGIYKGKIITPFSSAPIQGFVDQTEWPLWHMYAMLFSQIPPMLWVVLIVSIIVWLGRFWLANPEHEFELPFLSWRISLPHCPAKLGLFLGFLLPLVVAGSAGAFCYSFFVLNQGVGNTQVAWGVALFLLVPLVVLPSFRFNAVLPIYFLAMAIPFIRIVLGDIHFSFTLPPLAILFALWARYLWETSTVILSQGRRTAAQVTFMCFMGIGLADQLMNIPASAMVQRELLAGNMRAAEWIKSNLPKHSIVIGNSYNFADISYYSKFHVTPYVSNSAGYGLPVIPSRIELANLIKNNQGVRDVYFFASDHPYYIYQVNFHSHQFVKNPPGKLLKLAEFNVNKVYSYIDPIKYFVPRFFIPQAGYQDWETDFYFNNLDVPFRRIYFADYAIFKATS